MNYVHSTPESGLQTPCPDCKKIFKNREAMKNHLKYHKPPQHRCEICQKEYHTMTNLKSHVKNVHHEKKDFNCQYCDSSYFSNFHLNRHILTGHMKQKIACQVSGCPKTFPLQERYRSKNPSSFHAKKFYHFSLPRSYQSASSRSRRRKIRRTD